MSPGNDVESPRQGQAVHDYERDPRLWAASSEAHGPASGRTVGTHQSVQGTERKSLRWKWLTTE